MTTEEKIRSLLNPRLREIHQNIAGTLSMGDLAAYVGQPMTDAMNELAEFVETTTREKTLKVLASAMKKAYPEAAKLILDDVAKTNEAYKEFVAFLRGEK